MYSAVGILYVRASYLEHSLDACSAVHVTKYAGRLVAGGGLMGHTYCSRLAAAGIGGLFQCATTADQAREAEEEAGRWFVDDGLVSRCGHLG